jgi:hypothetical protein
MKPGYYTKAINALWLAGDSHNVKREPRHSGWPIKPSRERIVFFDPIGFGWVVDDRILREIRLSRFQDEQVIENLLRELSRNNCDRK